jgi:hypothetical protein
MKLATWQRWFIKARRGIGGQLKFSTIKIIIKKKVDKSCQKSCQKVVAKLSKSCQKVVKKVVKKLSKSCQKSRTWLKQFYSLF